MSQRNAIPRNPREVLAKERALAVLGRMRRDGLTLTAAAKIEETSPHTVRRYAGSALKRNGSRGSYRATKLDRIARPLNILTAKGEIPILVRNSRAASMMGEHLNAVKKYRNRGDNSALTPFRGKGIRTADGVVHQFITDTDVLDKLANAGVLAVEGLYRATHGG